MLKTLDIIYCYTCPSNIFWQKEVTGSKGDKYTVTYDEYNGWTCTCPGYQYHGGKVCKHIKKVEKERCGWNWEAYCGTIGEPIPDPKKPGKGFGLCPMCNEPVEILKVGV